jgi:hypothetical protein
MRWHRRSSASGFSSLSLRQSLSGILFMLATTIECAFARGGTGLHPGWTATTSSDHAARHSHAPHEAGKVWRTSSVPTLIFSEVVRNLQLAVDSPNSRSTNHSDAA